MLILTYFIIVGKDILVPIVFGLLFSFMLTPVYDLFCHYIKSRMLSSFLTVFTAFIPLALLFFFFGIQLSKVIAEFPDIIRGLEEGVNELSGYFADAFNMRRRETDQYLTEGIQELTDRPFEIIGTSLATSSSVLINVAMTTIYAFLFLLYRKPFKMLLLQQFTNDVRSDGRQMLNEIQEVAKKYFTGVITVMLILGTLNSIGLYFIGIDFPILWGFLAAILAIIPYIGTFLGGLLPFLYSFASGDGYWQPLAIIAMYGLVQTLEGNLITPKVVGKSVNINPLAAIIALFVGEAIWGLAGMIVALPLLAVARIVLDHIPNWQPIALALSDDFYEKAGMYRTHFNEDRFRLINIFTKQQKPITREQLKDRPETDKEIASENN
ncbi:hypothetical protein CEQ90_12515 [Lewinellaceae bacterium SD302]|nr:hypothetical protein CEQ90_12515 [Lewinellaceae bacterium SD302]